MSHFCTGASQKVQFELFKIRMLITLLCLSARMHLTVYAVALELEGLKLIKGRINEIYAPKFVVLYRHCGSSINSAKSDGELKVRKALRIS